MQLPSLLPNSLKYCEKANNDISLFDLLLKLPPHLIDFLIAASEDETWAASHPTFMVQAFNWVTDQFFQDRLLMEFIQKMLPSIRSHADSLKAYMPNNLKLQLIDREIAINSLLFSGASEFLRQMVRRECRDKRTSTLKLKNISYNVFDAIEEYLRRGTTDQLLHKEEPVIQLILDKAMEWEIDELSMQCQEYLKRYLSTANVIDTLIHSYTNHRLDLCQACIEYIDRLAMGCRFHLRNAQTLGFEFLDYNDECLEIYDKINKHISLLMFSGSRSDNAKMVEMVKNCPKLKCLDISYSTGFSEFLANLPRSFPEFEANGCAWLTNEKFIEIINFFPQLSRLVIRSNLKINYEGWGALSKLENLNSLDVSRCVQITDDEFKIILQACKSLRELTVEECRAIGDPAFIDIPLYTPNLAYLNVARTNISDLPLIEISTKCPLFYLNLSHCSFLTGKGIYLTVKNIYTLKELDITSCEISIEEINNLKKLKPFLKISY